jgi:flagellar protein FlaG
MNVSSINSLASHLIAANQAAQTTVPKPPNQDQKALLQAVKTVNASEMLGENELTFRIDKKAGIAVVRIVNRETGELVQQIPNEQVLRMAEESNRG